MFASYGELNWESYTVQPGDTLGAIAAKYGVSVQTIANQNRIADPNLIQVGQQLDIPLEDYEFAAAMEKQATTPMLPAPSIPVSSSTSGMWKYVIYAAVGIGIFVFLVMPAIKRQRSKPVQKEPT